MPDNPQPTLPAEGEYTDVERLFIDDQPRNTFPENQNSNFGVLRAALTSPLQDAVDEIDALYNELFIASSSAYLGLWEDELGITRSTALSDASRRFRLSARRTRGLFTRTRRKAIVEAYIQDTFGDSVEISPFGTPLTSGGLILHDELGDVTSLYHIVENISAFSYEVQISNSVTPDLVGLARDLTWLTPAHISFSITRF